MADASGKLEATELGVGAGIAVAVDGSDAVVKLDEGAKLTRTPAALTAVAKNKMKDTVDAKAGAGGGTAAVPVAAVDVAGSSAVASVGRVSGDMLRGLRLVKLSASNRADHAVSADAAASSTRGHRRRVRHRRAERFGGGDA